MHLCISMIHSIEIDSSRPCICSKNLLIHCILPYYSIILIPLLKVSVGKIFIEIGVADTFSRQNFKSIKHFKHVGSYIDQLFRMRETFFLRCMEAYSPKPWWFDTVTRGKKFL